MRPLPAPGNPSGVAPRYFIKRVGKQRDAALRLNPLRQAFDDHPFAEWPVGKAGVAEPQFATTSANHLRKRGSKRVMKLAARRNDHVREAFFSHVIPRQSLAGSAINQPASDHCPINPRASALSDCTSRAVRQCRSASCRISFASRPAARYDSPLMKTYQSSYSIRLRRSNRKPPPAGCGDDPSNHTPGLGSLNTSPSAQASAFGSAMIRATAAVLNSCSASGMRPGSAVASCFGSRYRAPRSSGSTASSALCNTSRLNSLRPGARNPIDAVRHSPSATPS